MKGQDKFVHWEDCRGGGEKTSRIWSNHSFKTTQELPKKQRTFLYSLKSIRTQSNMLVLWGCRSITYFGFSKVKFDSLDLFQACQQNPIAHWSLSGFVLGFVVTLQSGTLTQTRYYFYRTNTPWKTLMFQGSIMKDFKSKKTSVLLSCFTLSSWIVYRGKLTCSMVVFITRTS